MTTVNSIAFDTTTNASFGWFKALDCLKDANTSLATELAALKSANAWDTLVTTYGLK